MDLHRRVAQAGEQARSRPDRARCRVRTRVSPALHVLTRPPDVLAPLHRLVDEHLAPPPRPSPPTATTASAPSGMRAPVMILAASSGPSGRDGDMTRRDRLDDGRAGRARRPSRRRRRSPARRSRPCRSCRRGAGCAKRLSPRPAPGREPPPSGRDSTDSGRASASTRVLASSMLINFGANEATPLARVGGRTICTLRVNHLGTSADRKHSMSDMSQKPEPRDHHEHHCTRQPLLA